MKNIDKWNYYMNILNKRADVFMDSITKTIPVIFYEVYPIGTIHECHVTGRHYSHRMYFHTKNPTNKDVDKIKAYCDANEPLSSDLAYFDYWYSFGGAYKSTTAVKITDLMNQNGNKFLNKEDAESKSIDVVKQKEESNLFLTENKKNTRYDYIANGYKFLGWQNGWKHVYFDEDNNLCSESNKPHKSFGYTKDLHPEYCSCKEQKHRTIEVSHNSRGSENTVSCPICKIYWKYDCSD